MHYYQLWILFRIQYIENQKDFLGKKRNIINIPLNYNNKIIEGENYFNPNNNSIGHYSQGQNNKYSNKKILLIF